MSKQMRLVVAAMSLLAVGLLVWALLLRTPVSAPAPSTTDEVSTFSKPGARRGNQGAAERSAGADAGNRAGRGGAESNAVPATGTGTTNSALAPATTDRRGAGTGSLPGAPLDSVTVEPTYDASDLDVTPPVMLSPLVPKTATQPRADALPGAVRILVNENGTVESAKATVNPRTMSEAILITNALQAVTTWRFQPATKAGKAVRYSLLIPLSRF
jgi:Gram-negative bacterial TonB protein C-terminal